MSCKADQLAGGDGIEHKSNDAQGLGRKKKVEGHSELCVGRSDETKEISPLVVSE